MLKLDAALRRVLVWFRWRGLFLIGVFGVGLGAFLVGVGVTDRVSVVDAGIATKIYYTMGLFVLGGLDLGVPEGGPWWGRWMLWWVYFAAPAVTASAVVEGVVRVMNPQVWKLRRIREHVVLAGCGSLTMLYLERLRKTHPQVSVLIVESVVGGAFVDEARVRYQAQVFHGDITSAVTFEMIHVERAERVMLLTGDDFANLEAATKLLEMWPQLAGKVVVHVSDIALNRTLRATNVMAGCEVFNFHEQAAAHLVETHLLKHFKHTQHRDQVILAGFGRFGQTVLSRLQDHAIQCFNRVIVVDLVPERARQMFAEHVGFKAGYACEFIEGDMGDPGVWNKVQDLLDTHRSQPVYILGSDNDHVNLHVALWLSNKFGSLPEDKRPYMVVRSFKNSNFAEKLAKAKGFEVESVASLVSASMNKGWFPGPKKRLSFINLRPPPIIQQ